MKGWYFARQDNRLGFGDGREIVIGETHTVTTAEKDLELCEWGLHASKRLIDALEYAPGPMVYRVELGGEIIHGDDKMVATERRYLWGFDATEILRVFARRCALDVINLWDAPDIVVKYLTTGDESLRDAAGAAAWDAAGAAVWAAVWDAARAAAWDAAWDAAGGAAWDAAGAAWDAAWAAAWDAAWDAAGAAAWDAARDAARAAAWAAAGGGTYNRRLTSMIVAAHKRLAE